MKAYEINFDGLVGPTHNYAGLSWGNVASMKHKKAVANPRQAALEGLAKMKFLHDLGVRQAVLPPQLRPDMEFLRSRGFDGADAQVLENAYRTKPALLAAASSASAMWAANAATVSPSADCADGKVHFTPANLVSNLHRSLEAKTTTRVLRAIFADESHFIVHDPLPPELSDEGAANHMRLCEDHGSPGLEIFVYGKPGEFQPKHFPARQSLQASQAIARQHQLDPARSIFLQQNPDAIDAGSFHNDVVAVANQNFMIYQKDAFADEPDAIFSQIANACPHEDGLYITSDAISLEDAVKSYFFNSQIVTLPDGSMSLIAPIECRDFPRIRSFIEPANDDDPIKSVHYVEVRQSMHNGGGPACLRLRVVLTDAELSKLHGNVIFTDALHDQLKAWIEKHYREQLHPDDLRDPSLLEESQNALTELSQILQLELI